MCYIAFTLLRTSLFTILIPHEYIDLTRCVYWRLRSNVGDFTFADLRRSLPSR